MNSVVKKKLVVTVALVAMFGAACQSSTTIDTSEAASELAENATANESTDAGDPTTDGEPTAAPAPSATAAPEPAESDPEADPAPTEVAADDDAPSGATDAPTPEPEPTPEREPFEPSAEQLALVESIADADDWCAAATAVEAGTDSLDDLDFTNPVELEAGITMATAVFAATQPLAPPEIKADVDQTVEAFTEFAAALEDANWSFLDLDLAVIDEFDGPIELATYNIDVYNATVCGLDVDPGEPPTITDPSDTDSPGDSNDLPVEGTIREQAVAGLVEAGFTEEEANCVLSRLDVSDPEAFADTTALFGIFTDCGISLDRLAQLGGG